MTIIYTDVSQSGRIDTDALPSSYTYNADGTLATESVTYNGSTWTKTYSYTSGRLTGATAWVKQ